MSLMQIRRWVGFFVAGALTAALAIWWPVEPSHYVPTPIPSLTPTELAPTPLPRPSRPPHPYEIYRAPGIDR